MADEAEADAGDAGTGRGQAADERSGRDRRRYLGGVPSGGERGRGAAGKTPFAAAVETTADRRPRRLKLASVEGRRKKEVETIDQMQAVLDTYLDGYNRRRPHQGRGMKGRTPAQAFKQGLPKPQPTKGEKQTAPKAT
jgi:hypothetical protein